MSAENAELFASFATETNESLADVENDLLAIEAAGADIDDDLVNKVFRAIHSMKGSAGFLGLVTIGKLAHEMENVLNLVRSRELVPTSAVADALLRGADALRGMVNDLETSEQVDAAEFIIALKVAVAGDATPQCQELLSRDVDVMKPGGGLAFTMVPLTDLVCRQKQGCHIYVVEVDLIADLDPRGLTPLEFLSQFYRLGELIDSYMNTVGMGSLADELPDSMRFMMLVGSRLSAAELARRLFLPQDQVHHIASPERMEWGEGVSKQKPVSVVTPAPLPDSVPPAPRQNADATKSVAAPASAGVPSMQKDSSLRVNVNVLDTLMNLAGELVLSRNQLLQVVSMSESREIDLVAARIDQVTSELQDAIMQTRMQPIGTVLNKFPRVVRDLSARLGKQCELFIEGKSVELDKAIIEGIGDPLTHLVRNSVDHGVEGPQVRVAAGKPVAGRITLRAYHEAGKVNIAIADDGAGIDGARLKQKAVDRGIISADEAREMSERDAVRLVFHAGFSTADQVSDVSGRGVGMDVVKTNIEKLGGTVEIETEIGAGTTIKIKLPLTLAIIPSLVVRCGDDRYALPQVSISELVRVRSGEVPRRIQRVKNAEVLRLRGSLLPLVRLNAVLDVRSKYFDPIPRKLKDSHRERIADRRAPHADTAPPADQTRAVAPRRRDTSAGALNIIVVETGQLCYGLIVDALHDSEEIVVKPLGRHMKQCSCLAGATILGDGKVALILDVAGIAAHMDLAATGEADYLAEEAASSGTTVEMQSVLLLTNGPGEQFAVPMPLISRIERIRTEQIDTVGGQEVLQYRGCSLPLLSLEHHIKAKSRPSAPVLYVVVYAVSGREVGLIAPQLVDIRMIPAEIDGVTFAEPGVFGSTVVDGAATRLVDLHGLTVAAHPEWFGERIGRGGRAPASGASTILLAEDSDFFRKQLTLVLEEHGHQVVACSNGLMAWNTLQDPEQHFDLVITDIEMPELDGLALARKIKGDPGLANLAVIAVTSLAGEEDVQRGLASGVDEYQVKLDREQLIAAVARHLDRTRPAPGGSGESALAAARS